MEKVEHRIIESIEVKDKILHDKGFIFKIEKAAERITKSLRNNGKVFFCGNGGSAADAQHLAAELMGKFYLNRSPLQAVSLTTNTSVLTAIGNDFSYDEVFVRQLKGLGEKGDILVGISTSGNSKNVVEAMKFAKENGIFTIGLTGKTGGKMAEFSDILLNVPSSDTPRIQEAHIMIGHIICEIIEDELFGGIKE
ncbi:D-sedoheptulose 7-phosphate isomerase [Thermosipho atlanticus]|uniref:Phosphoheptose isomerase n=1 Tax=Thermosipho atlanticus DSM 15807 TaxID=1123380 RepID=A0A1M5RKY4_9BACT|nr:D-sedoheptulose 7-phosphate isomerase [Thermosipho atlanticus]SHH26871.1 phosphoheptose isomerase [Thermosipho atlanticus DSM 15807]